jgi:hypothetical protein
MASASVGDLFIYGVTCLQQRERRCATRQIPDGRMVSSRSHLSIMTQAPVLPEPGLIPFDGYQPAILFSAAVSRSRSYNKVQN